MNGLRKKKAFICLFASLFILCLSALCVMYGVFANPVMNLPATVVPSQNKPVIYVTSGETQVLPASRIVNIPEHTVLDETDSGIRTTVSIKDKFGKNVEIINGNSFYVNDDQIGDFTVTFDAVNSAGLQADTVTVTLTIEQPEAPVLSFIGGVGDMVGFKNSKISLPRVSVSSFYNYDITVKAEKNGVDYSQDINFREYGFVPEEAGNYTVKYEVVEQSDRKWSVAEEFDVEVKNVGVIIPFTLNSDTSTYVSASGGIKPEADPSLAIVSNDNFAEHGFATTCMAATYVGVVGSTPSGSWPGIDISMGKIGLTDISRYESVSVDLMFGSSGSMMIGMILVDVNGTRYEANYTFSERYETRTLSVDVEAASSVIDVTNVQTVTLYTYGFESGTKVMYFSNFSVNEKGE